MSGILVVDDNEGMLKSLEDTLEPLGARIHTATSADQALALFTRHQVPVIVTDVKMPGQSGIELLKKIKQISPDTSVIVMSAFVDVSEQQEILQSGAYVFLSKPFSLDHMYEAVRRALEADHNRRVSDAHREEQKLQYDFSNFVGQDPRMKEIYDLVLKIGPTKSSVLVSGESGTGKELVASAIHYHSPRWNAPFIKVNCGALAPGLIESELFGHTRGSFTGAVRDKQGRFALADGGTLFLDEIGDIDAPTQVKLLRVLQEGQFEPVGADKTMTVDVRIICATHRNLRKEIAGGRFREDLYYRLHVINIELPPLRERKADIPLLASHFLRKYARSYGKAIEEIDTEANAALTEYSWPGNVRELENIMERAAVLATGKSIGTPHLPSDITHEERPPSGTRLEVGSSFEVPPGKNLTEIMDGIESEIIRRTLDKAGGIQTRAARLLGLGRSALQYKMQKYGLLGRDRKASGTEPEGA